MKKRLCLLATLLAVPTLGFSNAQDAFVLIGVPQISGELTYEVVPRDQYAGRQAEARKRDKAVKQAYEDVKAEWTEERRENVKAAMEKNREEIRNQQKANRDNKNPVKTTTRTRTERESFSLGTFPLSEPPSLEIRYLGAFPSSDAAEVQLKKVQTRDQMVSKRTEGALQSKLARPSPAEHTRSGDSDRDVSALKAKLEARTEEVLTGVASEEPKEVGLKAPEHKNPIGGSTGIDRSTTGSGGKRLGEGLKEMQ